MFTTLHRRCMNQSGQPYRYFRRSIAALFHVIGILLSAGLLILPPFQASAADTAPSVYWGAMMKGSTYGYNDAPWDDRTITTFQANAGKKVSIIHWGQPWYWSAQRGYQPFQKKEVEKVRRLGAIPMVNWNAWDLASSSKSDQPAFKLSTIITGKHDTYLRQWASDAKAWGYPLFVRMNHEMNGDWYPWSERMNGNSAGQYVHAWRHVVDIFRQEGATNVTWVWCVNRVYDAAIPLKGLYPGDSYVDWVAVDSYNWGTNPAKPNQVWESFSQVVGPTYDQLQTLAPSKPVMIAELGSTEYGGSKSAWITDALQTQLPTNFPNIKAVVWFNWNIFEHSGTMDWAIESSKAAKEAFAAGIASNYYASNTFNNLPKLAKVQPLIPYQPNMIQNPSFETSGDLSWYAPWTTRNTLGATFTKDSSTHADGNNSMKVSIAKSNPQQPWLVQLRHHKLTFTAGQRYTISFVAKASKTRTVDVVLQKSGVKEYVKQQARLTTEWTRFTYTYTARTTADDVTFALNMAKETGQVRLDDVSIVVAKQPRAYLPLVVLVE